MTASQDLRRRLAEDVFAPAPRILSLRRAEQTCALIARVVQETESALAEHMSGSGVGIAGPELHAAPGAGPDTTFALLRDGGLLADPLLIERAIHRVVEADIAGRQGGEVGARAAALLERSGVPSRLVDAYVAERLSGVDADEGPRLALDAIPFERARAFLWSVAASLRYRILAVAPIDSSTVDDRIETAGTALLAALNARRSQMDAAQRMVERIAHAPEARAAFAGEALALGAYDLCEVALGWALEAERIVVRRVMFHEAPEDLALLCRGAGMRERDVRVVLETILPVRDGGGAGEGAGDGAGDGTEAMVALALAATRAPAKATLLGALHRWSLKPAYADGLCAIYAPAPAPADAPASERG